MSLYPDLLRFCHPNTIGQLREMFVAPDGGDISDIELACLLMIDAANQKPPILRTISGRSVRKNLALAEALKVGFSEAVSGLLALMEWQARSALEDGALQAFGARPDDTRISAIPLEVWANEWHLNIDDATVISGEGDLKYCLVQLRWAADDPLKLIQAWSGAGSPEQYRVQRGIGRPATTDPFVVAYVAEAEATGVWVEPDAELARKYFQWGLPRNLSRFNRSGSEVPSIDWLRRKLLKAYNGREKSRGK